jgi:hypothetical protein
MVCPFTNIRPNNHEILSSSQLIIIWTRNTNKGRRENGIKCKTHTHGSWRENRVRCTRHNNIGKTMNGII